MIGKVLAELLLISLMVVPHGVKKGAFELVEAPGKKVKVTFVRTEKPESIIEGMHEYRVTVHRKKPATIIYRFIDNGYYVVFPDGENDKVIYNLDIIEFLINRKRDEIWSKKQTVKIGKSGNVAVISPGKGFVTVSLKKCRASVIIDKGIAK